MNSPIMYIAWGIVALAIIALTGWVFYLTRSPWAFAVLLLLPRLTPNKSDDKKNKETKDE